MAWNPFNDDAGDQRASSDDRHGPAEDVPPTEVLRAPGPERPEDDRPDDDITQRIPLGPGGATAAGAVGHGPAATALDARTAVQPTDDPTSASIREEQERLAAERAARKEARLAALAPAPTRPAPATPPAKPQRRVTDGFWGSLGLFLLRAVLAFTLGVRGVNSLLNPTPARETFADTILPYPTYVALGVAALQIGLAVLLLLGMLTRLAGLGVTLLNGAILALVVWGAWSIFVEGQPGFLGEHELLMAAAGLLLLFLGAGAWSVDYAFRRRRRKIRAEREAMLG